MFKGFPPCYSNNVLLSRRVQMYITNQKNPMFHLYSYSKVNNLKCYMKLLFETA